MKNYMRFLLLSAGCLGGMSLYAMQGANKSAITSIETPNGADVFVALTMDPMMTGFLGGAAQEYEVLHSSLLSVLPGKHKLPTEIPLGLPGTATRLMVVSNGCVSYPKVPSNIGPNATLFVEPCVDGAAELRAD